MTHVIWNLSNQLSKQDERHTHNTLTHNTTKSRLAELEGRQGGAEQENAQLRRDKMLLVDHVSDLQKQVATDYLIYTQIIIFSESNCLVYWDLGIYNGTVWVFNSRHTSDWSK